jgi:hypothetical protein
VRGFFIPVRLNLLVAQFGGLLMGRDVLKEVLKQIPLTHPLHARPRSP